MNNKPVIEVRNPTLIAEYLWCELAQDDPARGWKEGQEIKTSRIVAHHPEHNAYETKNTVYVVVP